MNAKLSLFPHLHDYQTKAGPFWLQDRPLHLLRWWGIGASVAALLAGGALAAVWRGAASKLEPDER